MYKPVADSSKTSGYKFSQDGTRLWVACAPGTTSSGAIRLIDAVLASGRKVMAKKLVAFDMNSIEERMSWISGRRVFSMRRPKRGTKKASMNTI